MRGNIQKWVVALLCVAVALFCASELHAQKVAKAKAPAVAASVAPDVAAGSPRQDGGVKPPPQEPVPSAEFLVGYDKFLTLGEARANAEKKRAEYESAAKVLTEQINDLAAGLRAEMARVAPGYNWDPAKRSFVKPAPVEKPQSPPQPGGGEKP